MAKARAVTSGVLQHTTAQATAFTQQLRSGRVPAAPDPAVELEDSSWAPPRTPSADAHMQSPDAGPPAAATDAAAVGPALAELAGAAGGSPPSPVATGATADAAPDDRGGASSPFDLGAWAPGRPASPLLPSSSTSPTKFASPFRRPSSGGDLGRGAERQPSLRSSVDGSRSQHLSACGDTAPFNHEPVAAGGDIAAGGPAAALRGAGNALVSVHVCAAEVVPGATRGQHGEFPIVTTAGGREFRVVRRFRQVRKLQQQLRGSYGGGNLDLFLPAAGAHRVLCAVCCVADLPEALAGSDSATTVPCLHVIVVVKRM